MGKRTEPSLLWEELRRVWRTLRGSSLSPARAAAATALGLFIGSQPIFGCHTPIVLALCVWLELDAAICWVAANISNPFFAPFLISAEVQLGAYLRTGARVPFTAEMAKRAGISGFAGYAFLGAPAIGLGLAIIGATLVYVGMSIRRAFGPITPRPPYRLPDNAPSWWHAAERLALRYAPRYETVPAERGRFHYVRVKLQSDPICRLVADIAGARDGALGQVLDIGTGRGQMALMLLELGRATSAHGFDWDAAKIAEANAAAKVEGTGHRPLAATFTQGDATQTELEPADTVLIIDVIHYLTLAEQDDLLRRAARAVRPGGRLLVREADTERGWRSWITLGEELFFTAVRFNKGARVKFRPAREIAAVLGGEGLRCEIRPAWGKTPFCNVLILGQRPESTASERAEHGANC